MNSNGGPLENFQKDSSLKEYSERRVENGEDVMRYAQPVRLTSDCLVCHGGPVGEKDPFGYTKEGMKAGDLRGAFAISASAEGLVQPPAPFDFTLSNQFFSRCWPLPPSCSSWCEKLVHEAVGICRSIWLTRLPAMIWRWKICR